MKIYALYKGDEFICVGTGSDIASFIGATKNNIYRYKDGIVNSKKKYKLIELEEEND